MINSTPTLKRDKYGNRRWTLIGLLHRTDGPAFEGADGSKEWYLHGKLHRDDGPAVEYADGTKKWWVMGKEISAPYSHVLTAAFMRGLPSTEEVFSEIFQAMAAREQSQKDQLNRLHIILNKYWPTHVKKMLASLFSNPDPAIKHMAFSLLGQAAQQGENHVQSASLAQI